MVTATTISSYVTITDYSTLLLLRIVSVLMQAPRNEDVLGEWRYIAVRIYNLDTRWR
jgi:hypothetical protein